MKTMTEKQMNAKAVLLGVRVVTLQCSGYVRLVATRAGKDSRGTNRELATVETTDCTLPEARARVIAAAEKAVSK